MDWVPGKNERITESYENKIINLSSIWLIWKSRGKFQGLKKNSLKHDKN